MTKDEVVFELREIGETLRREFGALVAKCGSDFSDSVCLTGGKWEAFSALEGDIDRFLSIFEELFSLQSGLTSGFVPSNLHDGWELSPDTSSEPRASISSQSWLAGSALESLAAGFSPENVGKSLADTTVEAAAGRDGFPPLEAETTETGSGERDRSAAWESRTRAAVTAVQPVSEHERAMASWVESWAASASPVRGLRDLARALNSSPETETLEVRSGKSTKQPESRAGGPALPQAQVDGARENDDSQTDLPAGSGSLPRKPVLVRMGLDIARQSRPAVSPHVRTRRRVTEAPTLDPARSADAAEVPIPEQEQSAAHWQPQPRMEAATLPPPGMKPPPQPEDLEAIFEALAAEIQQAYRRFYGA